MLRQELFKFVFNDVDMRDIIFKYKNKFNCINCMGKIHRAIRQLLASKNYKRYNKLTDWSDIKKIVDRKKSIKGYICDPSENYGVIKNKKDVFKLLTKYLKNFDFVEFYDPKDALIDVSICLRFIYDTKWKSESILKYFVSKFFGDPREFYTNSYLGNMNNITFTLTKSQIDIVIYQLKNFMELIKPKPINILHVRLNSCCNYYNIPNILNEYFTDIIV